MEYQLDITTKIKHATIYHKKNDKRLRELIPAIKKAEKINQSYWDIKCPKYKIIIVYSEDEFDEFCKFKKGEPRKRIGMAMSNKTFIIYFKGFNEVTYSLESFISHELNHLFYTKLVGNGEPFWFFEGIATCIMKDYYFKVKEWKEYFRNMKDPKKFLYYNFNPGQYYKDPASFAILNTLILRYLHKNFGKGRILELLKEFSKNKNKKRFDALFEKTFNLTINEVISKSIE